MIADSTTLRALAQRAREASGSDRALDADVARALGWHQVYELETRHPLWRSPGGEVICGPPHWSFSLDAVIRDVVPEGRDWGINANSSCDYTEAWCCSVGWEDGHTPALALLAVALKARAALAEADHDRS